MLKIENYNYTPDRAGEVTDLFRRSVHDIDESIYTAEEKSVWAPVPPDYQHWADRLDRKLPYLAIIDARVVGFIELEPDGHIDCAYVDPDFQGRGVATELCEHIEKVATDMSINRLFVEASIVAKPLFEHMGFCVVHENRIERAGQVLVYFTM